MASKSSAVHSLRIPNELWEWLSEEAKRRELTPNGLVCDLLLVARRRAEEAKMAPKPKPAVAPVKAAATAVSVPFGGDVVRKPYQKGAKK